MVPVNGAELLFAFSLRTKPRAIASLSPLSHLPCTWIELVKLQDEPEMADGPMKIYSSENISCTGLESQYTVPKLLCQLPLPVNTLVFWVIEVRWTGILGRWFCDCPVGISSLETLLSRSILLWGDQKEQLLLVAFWDLGCGKAIPSNVPETWSNPKQRDFSAVLQRNRNQLTKIGCHLGSRLGNTNSSFCSTNQTTGGCVTRQPVSLGSVCFPLL